MSSQTAKARGGVDALIAWLEPYFTTKAPFQLPAEAKDWIVSYGWMVSLIIGLLMVPAVLGLLSVLTALGTVAVGFGVRVGPLYWLSGVALVIQMVLLFAAIPGLRARSYARGWKIVFYGEVFSAVYSLLHLTIFSIFGAALSAAISLFILFQVKKSYR